MLAIERISKCIWIINRTRIDSRTAPVAPTVSKYRGLRGALMVYFANRNPGLALAKLDVRVCHFINRNLRKLEPLEAQEVFCS